MEYNKAACLPPPVLYIERVIAYGLSDMFLKYMKGGRNYVRLRDSFIFNTVNNYLHKKNNRPSLEKLGGYFNLNNL